MDTIHADGKGVRGACRGCKQLKSARMGATIPTIFELACRKFELDEPYVDYFRRVDPDGVPDIARSLLQRQGVKLIGHPTLVDFAQQQAEVYVEQALMDFLTPSTMRRVGRPRADFTHDAILAGAFFRAEFHKLGATESRQRAAKLLGSPITKDRVEKGTARFVKAWWAVKRISPQLTEQDLQLGVARFLSGISQILDDCIADKQRLEHERSSRRKARPIAAILAHLREA